MNVDLRLEQAWVQIPAVPLTCVLGDVIALRLTTLPYEPEPATFFFGVTVRTQGVCEHITGI